MDRYADYEAMNDYPDVRCFAGDMLVYVIGDDGIITPMDIKTLAVEGDGYTILAYDKKKKKLVKVAAEHPRLSGRNVPILKIKLSNKEHLRVTVDHKILTVEKGYVEAKDLRKGDFLVGARAGFETRNKSMLTVHEAGGVWVTDDPQVDGVDTVYDVTTSTHNLLVNGVVCHNSAFHYFANDATQPNLDNGRVVWVSSPDQAIVDAADVMIKRRLRLEDDLFSIAFTLCQYGNDMEEILVTENGVVGLNTLATPTVRRVEKLNGSLIGFVQDVTGRFTANQDELRRMLAGNMSIPKQVAMFEDWQVCHFRLRSTARRSPYGVSTAEGARWIWKRLVMLEDAVMIYKLTRSPARYAFYVDVTDVPANRVESFLKRAKRDLKKKKMVNPKNNFLDMRYNPLANDEDFFIAVRDGRNLSRVEVLSGPDYQNVDDVQYFQRKLHGALMVPRAYLGQDAPVQGRAILSNEDVRAARVTLQVQRELKLGIERMIQTDFAARGFPNPRALNFQVMMTVPSNIYELAAMEVKNARSDFAARIQPYMSRQWVLENVFKVSEREIREIDKQREKEVAQADKMKMDPSFGSFTGGKPPDQPRQGGGELPPEALPPGQQQSGGMGGQAPPPAGATQTAWRHYDRNRRLEEQRHRKSMENHQKLVDMMGELQENDAQFARQLREAQAFMSEFRSAALRNVNGHVTGAPSAAPSRFSLRG
jgi:hypothetical protein